MADTVRVPDPVVGPGATGTIRFDRRGTPSPDRPSLVLIGGMTQTIHAWGGQLRPLSESRDVLAYEARGQGATALDVSDASLSRHVEDFVALVDALDLRRPVDLSGFSFGGRVALAIAAEHPALVRRLVLSGVALDRTVLGRLIVEGWIASLQSGNLEALARLSLADILGPAYLEKNAHLIDSMVKTAVSRNSFDGVKALFEGTMREPPDSPYGIPRLAARVKCPALVMGGALDRLAPPREVQALAQALGGQSRIFEDAGHTIPIEAPQAWREAVVAFLDAA
jgi:3-oxoadipate enol-lactonase